MKKHFQLVWLFGLGLALFPMLGRSNPITPLPSVEEVVKRAVERGKLEEENDRKFKQQYYFVRHRKTEIRNADGDVKKSKIRISTNAPVGGGGGTRADGFGGFGDTQPIGSSPVAERNAPQTRQEAD